MPRPERSHRNEYAVLWVRIGTDDYGDPLRAAAVEIKVRWVEGRREVSGPNGTPIAIDATIAAGQVIPDGSVLWKGKLAAFVNDGTNKLMQVVTSKEATDIKGRITAYEYGLQRYSEALPGTS